MAQTLDLVHAHAACTLWLEGIPPWRGHKTASIGQFQCADAAAGAHLLAIACDELASRGFEAVIGPLDGDTWHSYRLVTASDGSPAFYLEPQHPDFYLEAFTGAGLHPIAHYVSAQGALGHNRAAAHTYAQRLRAAQIHVRLFNPDAAEADLRAIHQLSLQAFQHNPFYTPIRFAAFYALYQPLLPHLHPELIYLAETVDNQPLAFLFALPNWQEGKNPQTVIVKTYASRYPGLGGYLLDTLHTEAPALGFQRFIHALMHVDNISCHNSARYGSVFRHYALFGCTLP